MKNEQSKLDWRRSKVLELYSQGYSQRDIAKSLQIGLGTVNKDLLFLRQQAREKLTISYSRQDTGGTSKLYDRS